MALSERGKWKARLCNRCELPLETEQPRGDNCYDCQELLELREFKRQVKAGTLGQSRSAWTISLNSHFKTGNWAWVHEHMYGHQ